jgi:hypothetical protein
VLTTLMDTLAKAERYSSVFEGNSQVLDQILASNHLLGTFPVNYDPVHVNAELADQASDHDPQVARLDLRGRPSPRSPRRGRRCGTLLEGGNALHRTARTRRPAPAWRGIWSSRGDPLHERRTVNPPMVPTQYNFLYSASGRPAGGRLRWPSSARR